MPFRKTDLGERIQDVLGIRLTARPVGNRRHNSFGILIVSSLVKQSAILSFPHAAPLLKEERNMIFAALIADGDDPFLPHWPSTGTALTSNDCPTDSGEIEFTEVFQQRLYGKKTDRGRAHFEDG